MTAGVNIKTMCKERFLHPNVGDKIQIFWIGQFILAQQGIFFPKYTSLVAYPWIVVGPYRGKAWWFADVIDRNLDGVNDLYHIRYDGWQNSWDEWVSRDRLRWFKGRDLACLPSSSPSTAEYIAKAMPIRVGDKVELEITGRLCHAWLECTVAEVILGTNARDMNATDPESTIYIPPVYIIRDAILGQDLRVGRERLRLIH